MRKLLFALVLNAFCLISFGVSHAASITYVSINPGSSSVSKWDGYGFNEVYSVEGIIAVTIDNDSYILFNFDAVNTIPDSGNLGSPFAPWVFFDGVAFDNRGQYTCTGYYCLPVMYDELWGTFDGVSLTFQGSGEAGNYLFSINATAISAVPVPAAGMLFISGLLGLIGYAKMRV